MLNLLVTCVALPLTLKRSDEADLLAARIATDVLADHATVNECDKALGIKWELPFSPIDVRHNLVPHPRAVLEVGGHLGEDLHFFTVRFPHAQIFSYEPVPSFAAALQESYEQNPNVHIVNEGVSDRDGPMEIIANGIASTSASVDSANETFRGVQRQMFKVHSRDVNSILEGIVQQTGVTPVVSINCEGCEYAVLARMLGTGWFGKVPFIQMSWHLADKVPNRLATRCAIEKVLRRSYTPTFGSFYGWQGWTLKV
jgi:FkbM family methyltransferase